EEMGMYWRDTELSYWWYRAPIETQAVMIELFDEVAQDDQAVEDLQVWLLKQKQTRDWKTTKATAEAIYALLLRGQNQLSSPALVTMTLGDRAVPISDPEAGTGYYEKRFSGAEVRPEQGDVTLTKQDEGVSWGSIHWQYLESMEHITPHEGTPLTVTKTLYRKIITEEGPTLVRIKEGDALQVGHELVTRLELRTDRDMEYLHVKDQRASGTEPRNVLSKYHFQDGLAYYQSTRDTATHYFIDYLPKGTYVLEDSVRVQHRGEYQSGMATVQCMYAPEFNGHSQSIPLIIGEK
ncbi:MAG: alpha-2-macroglobulin family protein, partial [Verrucomicrobiota bacterium]